MPGFSYALGLQSQASRGVRLHRHHEFVLDALEPLMTQQVANLHLTAQTKVGERHTERARGIGRVIERYGSDASVAL